eukprot:Tamp_18940.p1 GENE.Tamp_18940~~Tamp_18940.p1  ORF type:complete len:252 (-),score=10.75 Tamp_18940:535-1182(-)
MGQASSACCSDRSGHGALGDWPASTPRPANRPDDRAPTVPRNSGRGAAKDPEAEDSELMPPLSPAYDWSALNARNGPATETPDATHLYLLNCRKESWRYTPAKDHVGVGAYFECMQGGSIRVRGLAKGGPAESSQMINIGDELLCVDNNEVHGRPLSELGQFILGPPGSTVQLTFVSLSDKSKYDIFLTRAKAGSLASRAALERPTGEVENTLRV